MWYSFMFLISWKCSMRRWLLALCHHSSLCTCLLFKHRHRWTCTPAHTFLCSLYKLKKCIKPTLQWSLIRYTKTGINFSLGLMFSMLNCPPLGFLFGNLALQWRTTPLRYHSSFQTTLLWPQSMSYWIQAVACHQEMSCSLHCHRFMRWLTERWLWIPVPLECQTSKNQPVALLLPCWSKDKKLKTITSKFVR